jgi:hypothetical protein
MQREERSLGDLFAELTRETSTLVRKEVELAKTELGQKASKAGKNIGFLAIGGAVAYAGALALIGAVILLLAQALDSLWLSALLVGLLVAGVGAFLIQKGLAALRTVDLMPHKTLETLKEDKEWAKDQIS